MPGYFATGIEQIEISMPLFLLGFALGAVIGTLVSLMHTGSLLPLFSIMFVCTLVASLVLRISPSRSQEKSRVT